MKNKDKNKIMTHMCIYIYTVMCCGRRFIFDVQCEKDVINQMAFLTTCCH